MERANVDVIDILGYINNFVEHDHIKTIIICNEKELAIKFKNNNIDLDDEKMIFEMYNRMITNESVDIESNLKLVTPRSPITSLMQVAEKERLFMFDEIVKDRSGKVVASQKLFMLPNEYDLTFLRRKTR